MNTQDSNESTDLLTTEQVMDILLQDANLRRRAATCVLSGVRSGNELLFRRVDLDAWIEKQRESA